MVRGVRTRVGTALMKMYVTIPTDHVLTAVRLDTRAYYVKQVSWLATMPAHQHRLKQINQIFVFTLFKHICGILRLLLLSYVYRLYEWDIRTQLQQHLRPLS